MNWWEDASRVFHAAQMYPTAKAAAQHLGGNERTVQRAFKKIRQSPDAPPASSSDSDQTAIVSLEVEPPLSGVWDADELLIHHGLDPAEWIITNAYPNRWEALAPEGEVRELNQLKVTAQRRIPVDSLIPARTEGWKPDVQPAKCNVSSQLIAICSDAHAPYQDRGLESCFNQWLQKHQPARAYDLGDLVDLPTPSRHRTTPGFEASPQECIDERYRLDARRIAASPNTKWTALYGNHDSRVSSAIQDAIGTHVSRLCQAEADIPVVDLAHLLRYDELGIEPLRPDGDYHSAFARIVAGLAAHHGTKAGADGGAVKTMAKRRTSMLSGHDHKQVLQQHVWYDDCSEAITALSCSVGAMCQRDLGYVEDPDVAQGFATVVDHGDHGFHVELARYDDASRTLYWRDETFRAHE